jgi:exosortase K
MKLAASRLKPALIWSAQLALVGLCALALKSYYSTATADDLLWMLRPTTALVELLSGQRFEFESYAGYMSSDRRFVIAVPCAGVNFLITAFLMVALRRLWRERFKAISWRFIPLAALLAYVATLIANTTRIWLALEMRARALAVSGLTGNQMHRLEGIVVYFTFLLLLFVLLEHFEAAKPVKFARVLLFPLSIYYAMALGVPFLNGSFHRGSGFWEHSVYVLIVPLLLVVPWWCYERTKNMVDTARARNYDAARLQRYLNLFRLTSSWSNRQ